MTTTPADEQPSADRSLGRTLRNWARELVIVVVGALIASTLLRLFVAQPFVIPSGSMENTLMIRDRVLVQKVTGYQRGDIVVFRDTQDWLGPVRDESDAFYKALVFVGLAPDQSTNHLIKRLIGLPGDHVVCCDADGRITVNGTSIDETSYLHRDDTTGAQVASRLQFDVIVPKDRLFVMGDHRNNSQDSRCHLNDASGKDSLGAAAFIPKENIVGTVVAIIYPFDRFRIVQRPTVLDGVPAPKEAPPDEAVVTGTRPNC